MAKRKDTDPLGAALAVLAVQGIEASLDTLRGFRIVEGVEVSVVLADYRKIVVPWADLAGHVTSGPPENTQAR